jgi:uncharacterized protein YegP (UPF0339 family)
VKFEIYEDAQNEWRWTLKAANGQIVADGGEGYDSKSNCMKAVRRIKTKVARIGRAYVEVSKQPRHLRVTHRAITVATVLETL